LSAAPADAADDVRQRVEFISSHKGGQGAVRDLLELILKSRGIWDAIVKEFIEEGKGERQ
ncbi:MAG: 3-deoxy-D-manno-octulosonate 8-phosphate phosphatase, partial [Acidaminococcaceae bacterium]|nr:3-deoxy-D-manno-octulosonate 8-phosphate phosphatase [Acidaminococcaceae bacterium]